MSCEKNYSGKNVINATWKKQPGKKCPGKYEITEY